MPTRLVPQLYEHLEPSTQCHFVRDRLRVTVGAPEHLMQGANGLMLPGALTKPLSKHLSCLG